MKQIVCLSADRWQKSMNRTRHLLSAFPDAEIIYFVPGEKHGEAYDGKKVTPMTYLYSLPYLPVDGSGIPRSSGRWQKKLLRTIVGVLEYHRIENALFWVCSPLYNDLLDVLPHGGILYDCDREWYDYPILWESRLTSRADLVFAASEGLREHLSPCSNNIAVIPNGFNLARFDPDTLAETECPPEFYAMQRPLFGYIGTVWPNLNLEPALLAAVAHPEWTFVFVGGISRKNPWLHRLARLSNVRMLGPRPASAIPPFVAHLDVAVSFLRDGMEDDDVLSPRIYEYLAAGVPIVSMYHHLHREEYPLQIESAYSPERFVEMCEKMVNHDSVVRRAERQEIARACSWDSRRDTAAELVNNALLLGAPSGQSTGVDSLISELFRK